jgi:crotonobetainyl-CoA:carnitine CoA-transferase CaiB-like acyl-CoA transferase
MVASHPDGHVREAAVKALGMQTSVQEIPFLALRANDSVWPVAARAGDLLARRLVADRRPAVFAALPFLVRMLARRRQDHTRFAEAVRAVLVTDDAADLLARIETLDAAVLLLETLADRDEAVHSAAAHLLDGWVAAFNRYQVPPGPAHLSRIRELLDAHGSQLRADTASLMRFFLKVPGE